MTAVSNDKVIDRAFRNIKTIMGQVPESVEIFSEESINEITNEQWNELELVKIPVFRLVDYFVQNELIAPLVSSSSQLVKDIHSSLTRIEDAARLISLSSQDDADHQMDDDFSSFGDIQLFLEEQNERIENNMGSITSMFEKYRHEILSNLSRASSELHLFRLSRNAKE